MKRLGFLKKFLIAVRSRATSNQNFSYEFLKSTAEKSAARLGVSQLPLYMIHSPSQKDLINGEEINSLIRLKEEGAGFKNWYCYSEYY